ncbi:small ribosomal subunit protein eS26-like [Balaenoptera ricei]|uniref:small ribosomal subunit protein eS26-like n=1 Tax=Balaenoptera ricei TaxID=2746895 RepID=UPI0028BF49F5|nr:small ribosomal subunit protein eS26-like [Balaenoptera ricei]XP_061062626.1 small ribosomal subunit protein eS26-like [Eubalaena glacialis]
MTKERRNNGHAKKGCCPLQHIHCTNCTRYVPKDKAIKKLIIGNIEERRGMRDISKVRVFNTYVVSKLYVKLHCCVSCITDNREVKSHSHEAQKNHTPHPNLDLQMLPHDLCQSPCKELNP